MGQFSYTALNDTNSLIRGSLEARTTRAATAMLEKDGLLVVNIQRERGKTNERVREFLQRNAFQTVSVQERIAFTRNLQVMLDAGIPLDEAVATTAEQTTNRRFQLILHDIREHVRRGQPLHTALARHAQHFSEYYINFIRVGESAGKLDEVLAQLLLQQEKDQDLRNKARAAMIYPLVIVVAMVLMVTLMMVFVIPRVTAILFEYNVRPPVTTRILIAISNFLTHYGLILLPVVIVAIILFKRGIRKGRLKDWWDGFLLRLPYIKILVHEYNLARFLRSFTALLNSGFQLDKALSVAGDVPNNSQYRSAAHDGVRFVRRGVTFFDVLRRHPKLFPPLVLRMVEVGERTGRLNSMTQRAALFYEQSVDRALSTISSVIEPVLLILIGVVVGFVALAVLTPIWNFSKTI